MLAERSIEQDSRNRALVKPRSNEINISLNFAQQMFSDVACLFSHVQSVGGQTH